jgi:hypothetical protein
MTQHVASAHLFYRFMRVPETLDCDAKAAAGGLAGQRGLPIKTKSTAIARWLCQAHPAGVRGDSSRKTLRAVVVTTNAYDERSLFKMLDGHRGLAEHDGSVAPGYSHGVVLSVAGRPIGLWGVIEGRYVFRELGSYEPVLTATDPAEVLELSLALLALCRHGWCERFGPLDTGTVQAA